MRIEKYIISKNNNCLVREDFKNVNVKNKKKVLLRVYKNALKQLGYGHIAKISKKEI